MRTDHPIFLIKPARLRRFNDIPAGAVEGKPGNPVGSWHIPDKITQSLKIAGNDWASCQDKDGGLIER